MQPSSRPEQPVSPRVEHEEVHHAPVEGGAASRC